MLGLAPLSGSVLGGLAEALSVTPGSWSTPRTWIAAEVPTASMFNAHIRDNHTVLKVPFNDDGKVRALSSTYFADLNGNQLTGIVHLLVSTEFTAGKNNFGAGATTRVVVPVGTDLFDGVAGNKTAGSLWVEGDYLHHIASNQNEWRYLGTLVGTPGGAVVGSVWIESGEWHYIDSSGEERYVPGNSTSMHSDAAAVAGSVWVETYAHFISGAGTQEYYCHADIAHGDDGTGVHGDTHGDFTETGHVDFHNDTAHDDSHSDSPYSDYSDYAYTDYWDYIHMDEHTDNHTDVAHSDSHGDTAHVDTHGDQHNDQHTDTHTDHNDHADYAHEDAPESMGT